MLPQFRPIAGPSHLAESSLPAQELMALQAYFNSLGPVVPEQAPMGIPGPSHSVPSPLLRNFL